MQEVQQSYTGGTQGVRRQPRNLHPPLTPPTNIKGLLTQSQNGGTPLPNHPVFGYTTAESETLKTKIQTGNIQPSNLKLEKVHCSYPL